MAWHRFGFSGLRFGAFNEAPSFHPQKKTAVPRLGTAVGIGEMKAILICTS